MKPEVSSERWAVIGGGLMGLTLAARLAEAGRTVTLIEAGPTIGGLAAPHTFGGVTWDRFYHVILSTDNHLLGLLATLNLTGALQFERTGTGLHVNGQLQSISSPGELLRCRSIPLRAKLGLARCVAASMAPADVETLDAESALSWLARHSGSAAVDAIWRPLLRAKLGDAAESASALFIWTTLRRLYGVGAGRTGSGQFGFVKGGYRTILTAFEQRLAEMGVSLIVQWPVSHVSRRNARIVIRGTAGKALEFDRAAITLPDHHIAHVVPDLQEPERRRLEATRYLGVVCVSLLVDGPVTPYYVTNITDPGSPFTGVIEMTNLIGRDSLDGRSLLYLPLYLPATDPRYASDDSQLIDRFVGYLAKIAPDFSRRRVLATAVGRASHVLSLPTVGRLKTLTQATTSIPGLYIVNSAQIVDGTLNVNETIGHAERGAAFLLRATHSRKETAGRRMSWWVQHPPFADHLTELDIRNYGKELDGAGDFATRESHILDVGCGPGLVAQRLFGNCRSYTGLDVSMNALALARRRMGGDLRFKFLPLASEAPHDFGAVNGTRFDLVLCNSIIQYLPDETALLLLLKSMRSVVKSRGSVVISDIPVNWQPWSELSRLVAQSVSGPQRAATLAALFRRIAAMGLTPNSMPRPLIFQPNQLQSIATDAGFDARILPAKTRPAGTRVHVVCTPAS